MFLDEAGRDAFGPPSGVDVALGSAGNLGLPDPEAIDPSVHDRVTTQVSALSRSDDPMSFDLSAHSPVSSDELKEAVRASKVMPAQNP